jgi:hypothetical protein
MKTLSALLIVFVGMFNVDAADIDFGPAPGSPLKLAGGGHSFVMGDVNRDGKPDLIVCGGNALTVLLGNGRGGFERTASAPAKLPHGAGEMVTGDFNEDGLLDWAGAHHDHYDVVVMLGNGAGDFTPAPGSPFTARETGKRPHTHGLAAGDVNGDAKLDLVTANNEDDDVSVLLGDGKGGFARASGSPFPVGPGPYPIELADVNGDGRLDVLAPNSRPGFRTVTVLLGDGRGAFRPAPKSPFRTTGKINAYFVTAADVNGDRCPDLIVTHDEDSIVTLLLGDGHGDFKAAPGSPFKLGNGAWQVIAIDLDRDGDLDLVSAGQNAVAVLLGDGRGSFTHAMNSPFRTGKGSWRLAVADLNGDGKLDIVAGNVESDDISVLLMK